MEVVGAATRSIASTTEEEEEIRRKKYPSLPSNYVSLTQLQERWLQQQQQQNQEQEKKEHQQGKTTTTSSSQNQQRPEKPKKEEFDGQRSKNGERRIEGKREIYVPRRRVLGDGNRPGGIGAEDRESKRGAFLRVERADSRVMENRIKGKQKTYYNRGKSKMRMMAGALTGREHENMRNSGGENGRWKDEGSNWGELQRNDTTGDDRRADENLGVRPLEAVDEENRGKQVNVVSIGGEKCIDHEALGGGVCRRNGDDDCGMGGSLSRCMVEMPPENDEHKEEVPVHLLTADDQAPGIAQAANVSMVEVLPENVVQEGVLVGNGSKHSQGRFRGHYRGNFHHNRKEGVSEEGSKVQLGQGKDKEVEEKALSGKSEWNGDQIQRGRTRRGIQEGCAYKERVSNNLRPNIRRDFKALSLNDNREGNLTATKWLRGGRSGRCRESRDGGLVWMPKGGTSGKLCSSNGTTQVHR